MRIFSKDGDFAAFVGLLEKARQRIDVRILGWCLMGNHWHLVLWPRKDGDLSRFVMWLCTTHVRRWRAHRRSSGEGHLYQGRFKSFAVQTDEHLLTVLCYVEANAARARLVKRAELWPWSSVGASKVDVTLTESPVEKPANWMMQVNGERWVKATAKKLGAQSSLRDPWRPRKKQQRHS